MKWSNQQKSESDLRGLFWLGVVLVLFFSHAMVADWVMSWWR